MVDHDAFIDSLSRTAEPVKRPPLPAIRTAIWIAAALPCGALVGLYLGRDLIDWSAPGGAWAFVGLISAFILGTLAILSAFDLSIAGRKVVSWPWFVGLATVWLTASLICVAHAANPWGHPGSGSGCYIFMVTASLPMIILSILSLRRTRTLYPLPCLAAAGLGIAFMTITLLTLCHPPSGDLVDFVGHLVAAATIIVATIGFGRRWVAIPTSPKQR